MCGRYRLSRRKQLVEEYFDTVSGDDDWSPRYNIAPTQPIPVIRQNPKEPVRELSLMRWGLIPSWSNDSSGAARMINARSETAGTKLAFRDALKSRRQTGCLRHRGRAGLRRIAMCSWRWLGPAAKLIATIGPSHDRHLPTKKTSRVVHDHGIPDVRLYRGRTEVGAVHHLRNGPLPRAR